VVLVVIDEPKPEKDTHYAKLAGMNAAHWVSFANSFVGQACFSGRVKTGICEMARRAVLVYLKTQVAGRGAL